MPWLQAPMADSPRGSIRGFAWLIVLAIGAATATYGIHGVEEHCHFFKEMKQARALREKLLAQFVFNRESVHGLANSVARASTYPGGEDVAKYYRDYLDRVVAVSKADIQGGSALDQLISAGDFTTMKVLTSAVVITAEIFLSCGSSFSYRALYLAPDTPLPFHPRRSSSGFRSVLVLC